MLVLDTDGGVDDAQALLMLIAAGRAPDAITTVAGNVDLAQATRNILTVLQIAGRPDIPVHMGASRPLIAPPMSAPDIHGQDGLGGAARPDAIPDPAGRDGVIYLVRALRHAAEASQKIDLLMIGPLTNLALALRLAPDCAQGIGAITLMGGTSLGRGNSTPAAEFNILADPEAAAIVFAAEIPIHAVPWETCVAHHLTGAAVDDLFSSAPESPQKAFSKALADHARKVIAGYGGGDHFRFVDTLAAAVVIDPRIVTRSLQASIDVALAPGLTRGMTLVDPSGRLGTPPRRLIEEVDLHRLTQLFQASIAGSAL